MRGSTSARIASVTQPVSVTPGLTALTVIPSAHHLRRELAHEHLQRRLRRRVGQLAEHRAERLAARQADDPARLAVRMAARELAGEQHGRAHVDRVVGVERGGVHLGVAAVDRVRGVVDEHGRQRAEPLGRRVEQRRPARRGRPGRPRSPLAPSSRGQRAAVAARRDGEGDGVPARGQRAADGGADLALAARAGDERGAVDLGGSVTTAAIVPKDDGGCAARPAPTRIC